LRKRRDDKESKNPEASESSKKRSQREKRGCPEWWEANCTSPKWHRLIALGGDKSGRERGINNTLLPPSLERQTVQKEEKERMDGTG